ncbi:DUF4386 family protein [Sandaracinobacteroides saxicola]|uniref:DUF4386 family protein n=1 Tax=Sandaracinobacteroides saxicola TaxID=2759707 RepID=A0A7G5IG33_9SPHN|nr:DUF4386 family protein [Sandaracinobacteroides saxicola]QMW22325.1 DUF4386 family protein [Sandaracinobacteroides saxicola]
MSARAATGGAMLALGLLFNIPYSVLAVSFDYPGVLRLPAADILGRVAAGGPALVLTWYGFMLSALLLCAVAGLQAVSQRQRPAAMMVGTLGLLAGLLQAIGLSRWVFVVPAMAAAHADPMTTSAGRAAIEAAFLSLNALSGVAVGEHLGQLFTAAWVIGVAVGQNGRLRATGLGSAILIILGTGEGLAIALGGDGALFSLATVGGFLLLTAWLLGSGWAVLRRSGRRSGRDGGFAPPATAGATMTPAGPPC